MKTSRLQKSGRFIVLAVFAIGVLLPFVGIILAAIHPSGAPVGGLDWPSNVSWENFAIAWNQSGFNVLVLNSVIVAVCVVPAVLVLATIAAYGIEILRPPGGRAISTAFILGLTLPVELVAVALYFNLRNVGLTNTLAGVILSEVALFLPFGVFWMQNQFASIPAELVEAAKVDGAQPRAVLIKVLMPVSWHAVATLGVLVFMWSWNHFLLIVILLQDPALRTAPAGLGFFVGQYSTNIPLLSAASLIVMAPIVVVYLIFQRSFVAGITQGAIKG